MGLVILKLKITSRRKPRSLGSLAGVDVENGGADARVATPKSQDTRFGCRTGARPRGGISRPMRATKGSHFIRRDHQRRSNMGFRRVNRRWPGNRQGRVGSSTVLVYGESNVGIECSEWCSKTITCVRPTRSAFSTPKWPALKHPRI